MESVGKKLKNAKAEDFTVMKLLGVGKHGLVVKAKLNTSESSSSNDKTYAVKLLFNFTHEYTSVISNKFENEWLVLSRLLPHPNIVRYWSQFVSPISQSFIPHIPNDIRKEVVKKGVTSNGRGLTYRSGQFLVFDCHPSTLSQWVVENRSSKACTSSSIVFLKFSLELLEAVNYLQQHSVCHLDLKLDNVLVSKHTSLLLCDFGCAIQFEDSDFQLQWIHGASIGGNRAHLSPEVLTGYHQCRTDPTKKKICYKKQASFAVGVLIHEIVTGQHPIDDYPLSQMHDGIVSYPSSVITKTMPHVYPHIFQRTVNGLLHSNASERMDVSEALLNIKGLLHDYDQSVGATKQLNVEEKIQQLFLEKELAEERIKIVAMERDGALKEMKTMAEQCQEIVKEFESLAKECDGAKRQLKLLQKEKAAVEKASEGAFQAYDILKEQLHLVARERDIAKSQVEELRLICLKLKHEGGIRECVRCKSFFLDTDQKENCCWHKGVCYHNNNSIKFIL